MQSKGDCDLEYELKDRTLDEIQAKLAHLEDMCSSNAQELDAI
jgi:hypothetical protein